MKTRALLQLRSSVRTDAGPVRRDNQDAAFAGTSVLALADGMGGHPAGDVASSLMVQPFGWESDVPGWEVVDHLRAAMFKGEDAIADYVARNPHASGMGTTLTAVQLVGDRLGVLHAGDSRAYLLRAGRLYQLTRDDTFVQSLVDARALSKDEARVHPQRNIVLRALTGRQTRFGLMNFEMHDRDRLMLCSDGVSDALTDADITEALTGGDVDAAAELLVTRALEAGATDNVTCIVADVVPGPTDTSS